MSQAQKIMMAGGLLIILAGMAFGLYYAIFIEHQIIEGMGMALGASLVDAADGRLADSLQALTRYDDIRRQYIGSVHAHSHWTNLGLFLMLLGMAFKAVHYNERICTWLAVMLVSGSVLFPMGVWFEALHIGIPARVLSIMGSVILLTGFAGYAWGLRLSRDPAEK